MSLIHINPEASLSWRDSEHKTPLSKLRETHLSFSSCGNPYSRDTVAEDFCIKGKHCGPMEKIVLAEVGREHFVLMHETVVFEAPRAHVQSLAPPQTRHKHWSGKEVVEKDSVCRDEMNV